MNLQTEKIDLRICLPDLRSGRHLATDLPGPAALSSRERHPCKPEGRSEQRATTDTWFCTIVSRDGRTSHFLETVAVLGRKGKEPSGVYIGPTETKQRYFNVNVQSSNKSAANSPDKSSAPEGPTRMVLAVPDEPARGRKPVLRDELAAVVTIHRYPPERLHFNQSGKGEIQIARFV